jgi:SAM-dependent methyltransferase
MLDVLGQVGICISCGLMQRPGTSYWRSLCDEIYSTYVPYPQGDQSEVKVFFGGGVQSRSKAALDVFRRRLPSVSQPRWLDFGCGSGEFLEIVGNYHPKWSLYGTDKSRYSKKALESRPGLQFLEDSEYAEKNYDVVSIFHVLEHVENPSNLLNTLRACLNQNGRLLIRVPNHSENPYDLIIYDHVNFFSVCSLCSIVARAGLSILEVSTEWLPKEIAVVATNQSAEILSPEVTCDFDNEMEVVEKCFNQLQTNKSAAMEAIQQYEKTNIFGTAIGATWLSSEIGIENVEMFYDEDQARCGTIFLGRPVVFPSNSNLYPTIVPLDLKTKARVLSRYPGMSS